MLGRRRELRARSKDAENTLWQHLRRGGLGVKFKRQYSVMNYVVDFYCQKAKLAIELDGDIHKTPSVLKYDKYRAEYLKALGIREIRFDNTRVTKEISSVMCEIKSKLPLLK